MGIKIPTASGQAGGNEPSVPLHVGRIRSGDDSFSISISTESHPIASASLASIWAFRRILQDTGLSLAGMTACHLGGVSLVSRGRVDPPGNSTLPLQSMENSPRAPFRAALKASHGTCPGESPGSISTGMTAMAIPFVAISFPLSVSIHGLQIAARVLSFEAMDSILQLGCVLIGFFVGLCLAG